MKYISTCWQRNELGELVSFKSGGTPSKSKPDYWGGEIPWVSAKDLKSFEVSSSIERLTELGAQSAKIAKQGNILILVRGMTLYKDVPVSVVQRDLAFNQDIKAIVCSEHISPKYLTYLLRSRRSQLMRLVDTAGHGTGRLNTEILKEFPITYPSIHYQQSIIDKLELWRKGIALFESLIDTKLELRRGLIQQLLTGKQRLRGFTQPWSRKRMDALFKQRKETGFAQLPLIAITGKDGIVDRNELNRKDTSSADKSKYLRICPGDIGYNTMRMWQGVSALSDREGIISPAYTVCTPKSGVDGLFMAYLFKLPSVVNLFYRYSQGLTSDTWNLKFHHFSEVKVSIPEDIDEQKAIAKILQDCDSEIKQLHYKLTLLKEQKRGLMQKLLTGEWRLPVSEQPLSQPAEQAVTVSED